MTDQTIPAHPLRIVRVYPDRQETLVCAVLASQKWGLSNVAAVMIGDFPNGNVVRQLLVNQGLDFYVVPLRKTVDAAMASLDAAGYRPALMKRQGLRGSQESLTERIADALAEHVFEALSGGRAFTVVYPHDLASTDPEGVRSLATFLSVLLPDREVMRT